MRTIRSIVVHHSLTPDQHTLDWPAIRRYHMYQNRWRDVGYHAGVEIVGGRYEVLMGRPLYERGAHALGANHHSVGVCFIGNFTHEAPPDEQLRAGGGFIASLCLLLDLQPDQIVRHCDVTPGRSCPGAAFPIAELRRLVRREVTRWS